MHLPALNGLCPPPCTLRAPTPPAACMAVTLWMGYKVYVQQRAKNGVTASAATDKKSVAAKKAN